MYVIGKNIRNAGADTDGVQQIPLMRRPSFLSFESIGTSAPNSPHHESLHYSCPECSINTTMEKLTQPVSEVDPEAVEMIIADGHIGSRIKQLRTRRSMGLVELGQLTGLSASFLSQLETGRVVPTLRNLARLGLAFNKDLSYFFQPERRSFFRIQRRKDRIRLPQPRPTNPSHIAESFGILVPDRSLGPCLAEFFPNVDIPPFEPKLYQGQEMVYMISGILDIDFGGRNEHIEAGDVVFMDSETPRTFTCHGEDSATALIVSMPARSGRDASRTLKH